MSFTPPAASRTFAIDGHLHVYPGHDPAILTDACLRSLKAAAGQAGDIQPAALLAESAGHDFFRRARRDRPATVGGCRLEPGPDADTLWLRHPDHLQPLLLFAGRQIATRERLEVLALTRDLDISDGLPLDETLRQTSAGGAIACLAWSPGKWWGERGKTVSGLLADPERYLAIGDSALRPRGWRQPEAMRLAAQRGCPVLAGSDPLPIGGEERRAGQYGFLITLDGYDRLQPANALRAALARGNAVVSRIGRRCDAFRWLRGQIMLRRLRLHQNPNLPPTSGSS